MRRTGSGGTAPFLVRAPHPRHPRLPEEGGAAGNSVFDRFVPSGHSLRLFLLGGTSLFVP